MSKVMQAWETLLKQAVDKDEDTRQYAAFQMALILERHSTPNQDAPTVYEDNLSRELRRLTLSAERQRQAVQYLLQLAHNMPSMADAYLYAVSRADMMLALPLILAWLADNGDALSSDAAYQIVSSVQRAWRTNAALQAVLHDDAAIGAYLQTWAAHTDDVLAGDARRLLRLIEDAS